NNNNNNNNNNNDNNKNATTFEREHAFQGRRYKGSDRQKWNDNNDEMNDSTGRSTFRKYDSDMHKPRDREKRYTSSFAQNTGRRAFETASMQDDKWDSNKEKEKEKEKAFTEHFSSRGSQDRHERRHHDPQSFLQHGHNESFNKRFQSSLRFDSHAKHDVSNKRGYHNTQDSHRPFRGSGGEHFTTASQKLATGGGGGGGMDNMSSSRNNSLMKQSQGIDAATGGGRGRDSPDFHSRSEQPVKTQQRHSHDQHQGERFGQSQRTFLNSQEQEHHTRGHAHAHAHSKSYAHAHPQSQSQSQTQTQTQLQSQSQSQSHPRRQQHGQPSHFAMQVPHLPPSASSFSHLQGDAQISRQEGFMNNAGDAATSAEAKKQTSYRVQWNRPNVDATPTTNPTRTPILKDIMMNSLQSEQLMHLQSLYPYNLLSNVATVLITLIKNIKLIDNFYFFFI
ncbi:hypothetical protein RFI_13111, partial [Reticulomyxa filosa]